METAKSDPKRFFPPVANGFETRQEFLNWLDSPREELPPKVKSDKRALTHRTSPFVYLKETETFIGGHDDTLSYLKNLSPL